MQKHRLIPNIHYVDVPLEDNFPVSFFHHVQHHQDLQNLHYHHSFEIGLCIEGAGLFFVEHHTHTFSTGDISFIFPHQPHIAQSPDEVPSQWYFMTVDLSRLSSDNFDIVHDLLLNKSRFTPIISETLDPTLCMLYKMMLTELEHKKTGYQKIVSDLMHSFLIKIFRIMAAADDAPILNLPAVPPSAFTMISPALNHMSSYYAEDLNMDELAGLCHLSTSHFRTLFKTVTQQSPLHYLTHIRMKMATSLLLSTNLPVLSISQAVGYSTLSSFNRTFKALYMQTPSDFRRRR